MFVHIGYYRNMFFHRVMEPVNYTNDIFHEHLHRMSLNIHRNYPMFPSCHSLNNKTIQMIHCGGNKCDEHLHYIFLGLKKKRWKITVTEISLQHTFRLMLKYISATMIIHRYFEPCWPYSSKTFSRWSLFLCETDTYLMRKTGCLGTIRIAISYLIPF